MNGNGNFKMKCVDNCGCSYYTIGKIYEVKNGYWYDDFNGQSGSDSINTIDNVNVFSDAKWKLVEEEKPLIEIVMDRLGVKEGEEFNIIMGNGESSLCNPYKFKNGYLLSKYNDSSSAHLNCLIIGKYTIEKLPWKPNTYETIWYVGNNGIIYSSHFSSIYDLAMYRCGWAFKTIKDAKANKDRVLKEMNEVSEK